MQSADRIPPRMSRTGLVVLGVITALPVAYLAVLFGTIILQHLLQPEVVQGLVPVGFACLLWTNILLLPLLTLVYCLNAYREPLFNRNQKLIFTAILFVVGFVAQAVYYVLWLVLRHPVVLTIGGDTAPAPGLAVTDAGDLS